MNTHKFFTLAMLLAVALGSVAMAKDYLVGDNQTISGVTTGKLNNGDTVTIEGTPEATKNFTSLKNSEAHGKIVIQGKDEIRTVKGSGFIYNYDHSQPSQPLTLTLSYLKFTNSSVFTGGNGGVFYLAGGDVTVDSSKDTVFSSNAVSNQGGVFYCTNNLIFAGNSSKVTFTGNKANNVANDIYSSGNVTFKGTSTYTLDGGIVTSGNLSIQDGAILKFEANETNKAINSVTGNLTITGTGTQATFASGTTTYITGLTTDPDNATRIEESAVVEFKGEQTFKNVTVSNATATFDGKNDFSGKVKVHNGSTVTFKNTTGENTTGKDLTVGLLTLTNDTSKVVFEGTQQFTNILIRNGASGEIKSGTEFTSTSIVVDNRGELTIYDAFNKTSSSLEVRKGGVANLTFSDDSNSSEFQFNGNLNVGNSKFNGGTVNLAGDTTKLTVKGTLSGNNGDLNLAIYKTAISDGLWGVEGQTLSVSDISGEDFITVLAPTFAYHEESQMFPILTGNTTMTLGEFYKAFDLPFAWFASVDKEDFSFTNQNMDAKSGSGTFYIFKVDGDKVPEPSTWALLILGSVGLYFIRRRKTAK